MQRLFIQRLAVLPSALTSFSFAQPVQTNLRMWFDASDPAARTLDTTAPITVSSLINKAASGGTISQATKSKQPLLIAADLNGRDVMRFDGINDVLLNNAFSSTPMSEGTFFIVFAPMSSNGSYPGLISTGSSGQSDYLTGINIDLGSGFQSSFNYLNIEGPKLITPGGRNYRTTGNSNPFGQWHLLQVNYWSSRLELVVDGNREGRVTFTAPAVLNINEVRLGARWYSGSERGYGDIKLAEVLVYDSAADCDTLNTSALYLAAKYNIATSYLPPRLPCRFQRRLHPRFLRLSRFRECLLTERTQFRLQRRHRHRLL
ncbi:MAG: hypothetical protein KGS45_13195 [Planctomycetes bacterium]|nr:hypothetical protein [Planctomycetota bacterium]